MENNNNYKNSYPIQSGKDYNNEQSYNIINQNAFLNNNKSIPPYNNIYKSNNYLNNNNNSNNDEDDNLNMNININNYLSKKNTNNQKPKKQKVLKKTNSARYKDFPLPYLNKNINTNNKKRNTNNPNSKREANEIMKSRLLERVRQQKERFKKYDYRPINRNINITDKEKKEDILLKRKYENRQEEGNKKEEPKHVPKILTFLRTFKNFALPLKPNNDNKNNIKNKISNDKNESDKNFLINPNNSCFNFNSKPKIDKINNQRNKDNNTLFKNNKKEIYDEGDEGNDFIDYNRFTFRNNINDEEDNSSFKDNNNNNDKSGDVHNPYDNQNESYDSDMNQNINIDEYNRKYNNNYNKEININFRNNNRNNFNNYSEGDNIDYKKKLKKEQISPKFKERKNNFMGNKTIKPYHRKNYLKNRYSSPKPIPKEKIKNDNNSIYTYNHISKNNININIHQPFDNYSNNENEDSFQSLNISRYRKPILNNSFQRNNNTIGKSNSYYYNDISADQIHLSNNFLTSNRPTKKNKIHEIVININDSLDSFSNERNYNTNNVYSNRSPLKQKMYKTNTNSFFEKRSPMSSKQNKGVFDSSDNYDSSQFEDEEYSSIHYNKKNTNFTRFMEPFQKNDNQKWYNEDSYFSYDIVNMNNIAKSKKLLYQKPLKSGNRILNKNNSMYIKRVVHYDNKKDDSSLNNSDYINKSDIYNFRNRKEIEKEQNVHNFDAPKAIQDSMDEISNNNSDFMNDSSRENQFSINSDVNTNKLNTSMNNKSSHNEINDSKKNNQTLSHRNSEKIIYMKKLNTVYNFYQGTKKLFSRINNNFFRISKKDGKKDDDKNIKIENKPLNNIDNNLNNEKNSNLRNKPNPLKYPGPATPRVENENNNSPSFSKNLVGTPMVDDNSNSKNEKKEALINSKIINKKKCFVKKYYSYYISKIKNKSYCNSHITKINSLKSYKIPNIPMYYMTKETKKSYKIPLNSQKCYFTKKYLITNGKNINDNYEHQQICSFFSVGKNFNEESNEKNTINNIGEQSKDKEKEENKILNIKQNLFVNDRQVQFILSNDFDKMENELNSHKNSFSFRDQLNFAKIKTNSNNINENENIEIHNFNFTISPKKDNFKFEKEKIIPQKNNDLSIINDKPNSKKINKYDYDYILSLKNNQLSNKNNLLPKQVIEHLQNMSKETDSTPYDCKKSDKDSKDKLKKKFKKEDIEKIIKHYLTANKKEELKKIIDKNSMSEKKNKELEKSKGTNNNSNNNNDYIKVKLAWFRKDLSKEIEQAEKYIKELKKKMGENTKRNDIICLLNMLTVDNLNSISNQILELIIKNDDKEILPDKDIIYNEYNLIKVIVDKAVKEKRFVNLYAKLCKELYNKLNDKIYNNINFKSILIEECKIKFNEINNIDNDITDNNNINLDDEKYFLIKKDFLGNIDFICELINEDILTPEIGFFYLEELFKKYNNYDIHNEVDKFKKFLVLEAIVNFLSKFGKKIYENKNINNFKYLNFFIDNNLNSILKSENLPGFLKYKIINLIEKQKNKWQESLYEKSILAKGKKNIKKNINSLSVNKPHRTRKRKHSNKSLKSISPDNFISNQNKIENNSLNTFKNISVIDSFNSNSSINTNNNNDDIIKLIEEDLEKYEQFIKKNNILSKTELDKNNQIGNDYDWSMVENILSKNNIDLGELIRYYVEVCIDKITNNEKIYIANDYIKNIIYYYSINLENKEKDIIHNKMIALFRNIQDICVDNYCMKEIMGYLLFCLIENKLFFIKDLNNFIGMDKEIIITIAEMIKYAIISSGAKSKKYHNDFKQTKLFADNSIFNDYITNKIQDSLNHF